MAKQRMVISEHALNQLEAKCLGKGLKFEEVGLF